MLSNILLSNSKYEINYSGINFLFKYSLDKCTLTGIITYALNYNAPNTTCRLKRIGGQTLVYLETDPNVDILEIKIKKSFLKIIYILRLLLVLCMIMLCQFVHLLPRTHLSYLLFLILVLFFFKIIKKLYFKKNFQRVIVI